MTIALDMNPERAEHTLVVVFLRGGADGLGMVVPIEDDAYYALRPTLSVAKGDALPLDDRFGLHPRLAALEAAYKDGALLLVHGAGSEDGTRSHFEAQDLMEHGGEVGGGWMGRWQRVRAAGGNPAGPLSAITLGTQPAESLRGAPGSVVMESPESLYFDGAAAFNAGLRALYGSAAGALGDSGREMLDALDWLESLRTAAYRPANGAVYSRKSLGKNLRLAAQLIKSGLGVSAMSIDMNGWDTHVSAATGMPPLLEELGGALASFYQDMGPAMARCTVLVMSEFGRRAYENASFGTDHGRGGVMFILGGGVRGGRVLAEWQGLERDKLEGPGDLPVAHNYRNVVAPVLLRHGAVDSLDEVFPGAAIAPLGLYG